MMRLVALALTLCASTAAAGVNEAVTDHAVPATDAFSAATEVLRGAAEADCTARNVRPAWNDAFDAWLGLSHLRFGPLEDGSRALTIAFWPDTRGMTPRALGRLIADEDPVVDSVDGFAEVSIAARGFHAMERLLYAKDHAGYGPETYACRLVQAQARDLARSADVIAREWVDFAATVRSAGDPGNDTFLSEREAAQAFYTALTTGLEFVRDQRLGRPLGSFDDPRPDLAEARLSGRSLRNVTLSLAALENLALALGPEDMPRTLTAFDSARADASRIRSSDFSTVSDPARRIRIEALQHRVEEARAAVAAEIGTALGVSQGFNSADGD